MPANLTFIEFLLVKLIYEQRFGATTENVQPPNEVEFGRGLLDEWKTLRTA